jgi:[ribosomal protein S18]-alanine N-acetyltransferase
LGNDALMRSDLEISKAEPGDVPRLTAIAQECGLVVDFPAELARSYAELLVARATREPIGFLLAWRAADELHLTDLGVTASARRRGVAWALVAELRRVARELQSRVILLEVRESNAAAVGLYTRVGFQELDRRARYYTDTGEDAVVMALELG